MQNNPTKQLGENGNLITSSLLITPAAGLTDPIFENHDNDSIERSTVLGARLTNPYLLPNITQAYHNLGIYNVPIVITNLYVRFKPNSVDQLAVLDSIVETQNLELFDTPLDFDVVYEGDYYQDAAIPEEQITWQYAVVPPDFQFPAGIQYETLAQIHIPGNEYTAVETEAENLAGGGGTLLSVANGGIIEPNVPLCADGFHWDYNLRTCVANNCQPGYHWSGTACVIDQVSQPPAPAADAAVPAGFIRVHDTQLNNTDPGVQKARIVAKRWFKIERVYTDNNGHFQCTKRFKHKVKINLKFKNDDAQVRGFRGLRLWQMLFPVKKTLGIYSGDKTVINYTAVITGSINSKGNRYFAAATVHNALQEYRVYAVQEGIALPPTGIKIMLTNWGNGSASTPMFAKRWFDGLVTELLLTYFAGAANPIAGGVAAALIVLKRQVDVVMSYNVPINRFTSGFLKETAYHELTHAGHYAGLGNGWYSNFVNSEIVAVVNSFNSAASPYGNGSNILISPVIALGESWAYYMGHFLSDRMYGTLAECQQEQVGGGNFCNPPGGTNHPHIDVVENFDPNLATDPFRWIPQGLFLDLRDPANEIFPLRPVNDNVSGYTNQQMFAAFQSNINTLQDYRVRLLQTTTNPTSASVINLFNQYHY